MGALLALASALSYGLSDFVGGLLSRRVSFVAVALVGQLGGLGVALLAVPFVATTAPNSADLGWGALSGVGTGVGMMFLFRGLSRGAMSVVVPVSAVGGVVLPVLVGVAVLGDRPPVLSWVGIVVAVPALWLVSRTGTDGAKVAEAVLDGLIASAGIALQYLALAQAGPGDAVWPIVAGRVAAALTIPVLAVCTGGGLRRAGPVLSHTGRSQFGRKSGSRSSAELGVPRRERSSARARLSWPQVLGAVGTGALAAVALGCYLLATRHQLLVIAVVLSSLYPLVPTVLGIAVLRERLTPWQAGGLVAGLAATALITSG